MAVKKLKRGVALVGAGMTSFGAFPGLNTRDLFVQAFREMQGSVDKGFDPKDIEALVIGNYSRVRTSWRLSSPMRWVSPRFPRPAPNAHAPAVVSRFAKPS
jgi:acetyl-CoA acetyltransferase